MGHLCPKILLPSLCAGRGAQCRARIVWITSTVVPRKNLTLFPKLVGRIPRAESQERFRVFESGRKRCPEALPDSLPAVGHPGNAVPKGSGVRISHNSVASTALRDEHIRPGGKPRSNRCALSRAVPHLAEQHIWTAPGARRRLYRVRHDEITLSLLWIPDS